MCYNSQIMSSQLAMFGKWYFLEKPTGIIKSYSEYFSALFEIVPFGYLMRTLLSPWKNIIDRTPRRGINISLIFEAFCLSLLARGVGMTIRIITIFIGILLHILLLSFSVIYLMTWFFFPFLTVLSIAVLTASI